MAVPAPRALRALPVPAGARALELLPLLADALAGRSDAAWHPHAAGQAPHPALRTGEALAPGEDDPDDPTAVVVATSGSTGTPKGALLSAGALRASADATARRLAGPAAGTGAEQWVLALPAHHVAGLQVLLRSVRAGTEPVVVDTAGGFDPAAFAAATAAATAPRLLTSLVPTQLVRLLDAGAEATAALTAYAAVLVGAAATPAPLLARARAAGVRVVTTYGMSETCGGCVYDGRPLDGVSAALEDDGRLALTGPVVARGYRGLPGHPAFRTAPDGTRTFRTDDAAALERDGSTTDGRTGGGAGGGVLVRVTGRLDDLITTGGLKVAPALVEDALAAAPGVAEAVVVGVPDAEWGQRVVAAVVPAPGATPTLEGLRAAVRERLAAHAAPRQLLLLDALPLRGPGKPDRAALRDAAARAGGTDRAPRSS
ncbi:o-succinylbenzoate--CoA ligase [Kineococcus sp. SYSU DK005]|uniref:o-succinylbenzoate--CoA ligase n=1 Tax=Kineococcus sp. SYSU DK005 TaxID=3383126 RepID=UPI003D7CACA6